MLSAGFSDQEADDPPVNAKAFREFFRFRPFSEFFRSSSPVLDDPGCLHLIQ